MKARHIITTLFFGLISLMGISQDTFSIVAVDPDTGEVGSAGASCVDLTNFPGLADHFLGELFPGTGAINTQAYYNQTNQINARNRMNAGDRPEQIIQWLVNNDVENLPQLRQYGITALINGSPESAAHTGSSTDNYKNHITGPNYAIQGNILLGQEILDSMEAKFLNAEGDLACKLMAALQGANVVGADTRCAPNGSSALFAFVKVAQPNDEFGNPSFVLSVRTAYGDEVEPVDSLQVLFDNNRNCIALNSNGEKDETTNFLIYPNPVEDIITIESKDSKTYQLEVTDLKGSIMYTAPFRNNLDIKTALFPKGTYFIKLSNDEDSYTTKVVKN